MYQAGGVHVEQLSNSQEPDPPVPATSEKKRRARALYDFNPSEENELRFRKGDIIDVTEGKPAGDIIDVVEGKCEGWWGSLRGQTGRFPANYVEELFDFQETDQPGQAGRERDRRAMYGIHPSEEGRLGPREADNTDFAARKFDEMYGTALDEPAESADDFTDSVGQEREVARSSDVKDRKEPWGDSLRT
ncbi:ESCRT-0 subunit protein hse1 [Friedmanniomyces endolithicus]|nr:ESCRT-0 subunit protein hse1 [Friedmanniomyces endolithicus]